MEDAISPGVSVIVPNYNHADYLKKRIDSILSQTFQDFELILLDDQSQDNSKEVIEQYRHDPKVAHVVYNEVNSGTTFKQWDKGIALAQGELIWIAESDDWCEPTLLETLVAGFTANPNCVLGYVQSYTVKDEREIIRQSFHPYFGEQVAGLLFIQKYMVWACSIFNASMALFKKQAYYAVSKEYTSFRLCGDWVFWTEIARQGDVFISGKVLNYFRKHNKDVSSKVYGSGLNFSEEIRVLNLLRSKGQVDTAMYKEALSIKYTIFQGIKKNFGADVIHTFEKQIQETGYRNYLVAKAKLFATKRKVATLFKKLRLVD